MKKQTRNETMRKYFRKTQDQPRSGKRWTLEEDCLIIMNPLNDNELSRIIQRSQHAITQRRSELRKRKNYVNSLGKKIIEGFNYVKL